MRSEKFRFIIVFVFLAIFSAKMIISIAPVFSFQMDHTMMNDVIMQLELEHSNEKDSSKNGLKSLETKLFCSAAFSFKALVKGYNISNTFIEHSKRYVNPYHPSVPTPPPNQV